MKKTQPRIQASTVITGHANADFDALAAMVAASKLYPDAVLIFPGTQERNLRNFFIESATYMFNFKQARDIDPKSVKKLVVVDTRQRSRVPHVEAILEESSPEIHLFDHHPDTEEDLPATQSIVKPWGSTTAIIVKLLREKKISLGAEEATMLGLGIFEDTGSFTFTSTTEHDFAAAAWLKEQGMDLNTIADLITRNLTSEQVTILNTLLQSAQTHDINGIPVVLAEATLEHYVGDFALLAHKMLDMENIKVLFAFGRMGDRVHIVARSRLPEVDVGQICTSLGGGGHGFAASASVKDRTLAQVKDELFGLLYSSVNPQKLVKEHMSTPAISVEDSATIQKAGEIMNRLNRKAVPIVSTKNHQVVGYLENQTATRAVSHGLGNMPVTEYMQRNVRTVEADDDLYPVMEIVVGQRQRLVPVVNSQKKLLGVITRTDLINTLVEEPARIPEVLLPEKRRERNITSVLRERLPDKHYGWLKLAGDLADRMNLPLYAVGGFVRDLLIGKKNLDLDLVVEGDGILFARELSRELHGRIRAHHKFRTAVVIFLDEEGEEQRFDVATARLEYYEYPAALPTVELSSIKMDLYRRDFTINAQAIQLNQKYFGRLVDFFGAQKDMKDKLVRVLHSLSFVEDPTRILRAIRFEKRFGFRMGPQTTRLVKNALGLGLLDKLSGSRLCNELRIICNDEKPLACLERIEEFGILRMVHPQMGLTPTKKLLLGELEQVINWYRLLYLTPSPSPWICYLLGLTINAKFTDVDTITKKLAFPDKQRHEFLLLRENSREAGMLLGRWAKNDESMSGLYAILSSIPIEGLLYLMSRSKTELQKKHISLYLTKLKDITVDITGEDLKHMGFSPGPAFGRVLRRLLSAKLDGHASSRKAQLEMAYSMLQEEAPKDACSYPQPYHKKYQSRK